VNAATQIEPVISALLEIRRNEHNGVLEIEAEGVCTVVYVARGVPVFAEEGTLGETLGRLLLRERVLTQEQYARIIDRMTASVMGAEQMRFGEVALALGFLTAEQVNEALAKQVRRKIVRCIEAHGSACTFREGADQLEGIARYPCLIEALILRTVCATFDEARVARTLEGTASRYPHLLESSEQLSRRFKMDPAETAFVEEIDGSRTALQLIYTTALGGLHASQVLAVLALAGALTFRERAVSEAAPIDSSAVAAPSQSQIGPEPASAGTPAAVLARQSPQPEPPPSSELLPGSMRGDALPAPSERSKRPSDAARLAARHRLARRLARHADRGPPASRPGAAAPSQAEKRAPPRSPPPVAKQARLLAEQRFQSGKLHVRHERWQLAVQELREAMRLYPGALEYQLYAEWARFRTLSDGAEIELARDRLAQLVGRALRQDRQMAIAHHVAGQIKLMHGDEAGALRSFHVAVKLDPNDRVGARYARILSRKLG
jgi:hypothetical protein